VALLEQRNIGAPRIGMGDYLADWIETRAAEIELTTMAGYRRWIGHIRRYQAAMLPLDRVTAGDLEKMYRAMLSTPVGRGKPLSPVSVRPAQARYQAGPALAGKH